MNEVANGEDTRRRSPQQDIESEKDELLIPRNIITVVGVVAQTGIEIEERRNGEEKEMVWWLKTDGDNATSVNFNEQRPPGSVSGSDAERTK